MGNGFDDSSERAFLESESYRFNKMTNFGVFGNENSVNNQISSGVSLQHSTGSSDSVSGKVLFTAAQWQELERQTLIYKYIMASIPIPPQLLIPNLSTQSNRGVELRLSNGSDPEPWRCRRTDGKKWRCSRDVAPDQKYCERHAHKSRPRSRKHVEIQSHNNNVTTSALNVTPTTPSSYQHPSEWFMKSGTIPVSSSSQQVQTMNANSPRVGTKRTHIFPQEFNGNHQYSSSATSESSAGARRQQFIDAWSRSGGGGDTCSLTLSMQCSGGIDNDNGDDHGFEIGDVMKSHNQWLNQSSWMGSPPGGPLGEALGLGVVASTVKGPLSVPSPHGHSGSKSTSSSCENR